VGRKGRLQWVGRADYSGSERPITVGQKGRLQWVGRANYSGSEGPIIVGTHGRASQPLISNRNIRVGFHSTKSI